MNPGTFTSVTDISRGMRGPLGTAVEQESSDHHTRTLTAADARTRNTADAHGINLHMLFVRAVDATGISREAIARELGVSETILSRCYTGKRPPSLELLCDVAAMAGMQVEIELKKRRTPKG